MTQLEQIKAEITQRQKKLRAGVENEEVYTRKQRKEMIIAYEELSRLLLFIESLAKELPLMNGDDDLYFDNWNQQHDNPTKRECFLEGMKYRKSLEKSAKRSYKDCNGCEYNRTVKDQIGWKFRGCFGGNYQGKPIAEIELCPLKVALLEQPQGLDEAAEGSTRYELVATTFGTIVRVGWFLDVELLDLFRMDVTAKCKESDRVMIKVFKINKNGNGGGDDR